MELISDAQEVLIAAAKDGVVLGCENASLGQLFWIGFSMAGETNPANQLDIAKSAARTFDIRLQHVDRLTVLATFFQTRLLHGVDDTIAASHRPQAKRICETVEELLTARQETAFHQCRKDDWISPAKL